MTALIPLLAAAAAGFAAPMPAPGAHDPVETAATHGRTDPVNAEIFAQADALYDRRDEPGAAENARKLLERALAVSPLDTGLLWRYGRARVATGERTRGWGRGEHFVAAEQSLRAAIDIDPENVEARYWLAAARFRRGHYHDALDAVDGALALSPDDARLHHLAGDIMWSAPRIAGGDRKRAVDEYEKALALSTRFAENYLSLAEAYEELGRPAEAASVLDRLDRQPAAPGARLVTADRDRLVKLRKRLGQ